MKGKKKPKLVGTGRRKMLARLARQVPGVLCFCAAMSIVYACPVFAATNIWTKAKEIMQDVKTLLDSEFTPRFNLLAENQDEILRRVPTEEDEELWNTRLAALEAMVKKHSREIAAFRKAN